MPTKRQITCFTDLKGSTAATQQMGHQAYMPRLEEHLRVGRCLAEINGGTYIKNIGDAHMVSFDYIEYALNFAAQLQQVCSPAPGLLVPPFLARISLFLGAVEPRENDVFGSGVNQASRLEKATEAGQATCNEPLFEDMKAAFGAEEVAAFCHSIGEHELKGIDGKQTLYNFDWKTYVERHPEASIASRMHEHLKLTHIEASNISAADLNRPGMIIWPVVPRDLATAIHRAQIEVIRLLAQIGWQITVLLADCGGEAEYLREYVDTFEAHLNARITKRELRVSAVRMSDLYEPSHPEYSQVHTAFRRISSKMSVEDLMSINKKKYAAPVQAEMNEKPTLTYLRPILTIAAVLHLASKKGGKNIVIAGKDEFLQWSHAYNLPKALGLIGVLMIPVLTTDREHQLQQKKRFPIWHSEDQLISSLDGTNTAWWIYSLLALLPAFPEQSVNLKKQRIQPSDWLDEQTLPASVDARALIDCVWPLLNPA
jgi:class 3 adenylate cyclase